MLRTLPLRFRKPSRRCRVATPRRWAAAIGAVPHASESLEPRTLLAGSGAVCTISGQTGGDFVVNADDFDKVVVSGGSTLDSLTVNGNADAFRVVTTAGTTVGTLTLNGGSGNETIAVYGDVIDLLGGGAGGNDTIGLFNGGRIGNVQFDGGEGTNRITLAGQVFNLLDYTGGSGYDAMLVVRHQQGAFLQVDLGDGNNRLNYRDNFDGGAGFGSVLEIESGRGNDTILVGRSLLQILDIDSGDGNDRIGLTSGLNVREEPGFTTGIIGVTTGGGSDRVTIDDDVTADTIAAVYMGSGDDRLWVGRADLGAIHFDVGTSDTRDAVALGARSIGGSTRGDLNKVVFDGNVVVTETAQQTIVGGLWFEGGFATQSANIRLDQNSVYTGNRNTGLRFLNQPQSGAVYSIRVAAQFVAGADARVEYGNPLNSVNRMNIDFSGSSVATGSRISIATGSGDDFVRLRNVTGSGTVEVDLGAGDDELDVGGLAAGIIATLDGGDGFDTVNDPSIGTQSNFEA